MGLYFGGGGVGVAKSFEKGFVKITLGDKRDTEMFSSAGEGN